MTYSFTGFTVSNTYQRLVQVIDGQYYYDGLGNPLSIGSGSSAGLTGPTGANGISINWMGDWDPLMLYFFYDAVYYSGSSYIYTQVGPSDNTPPSMTSSWSLMVGLGTQSASVAVSPTQIAFGASPSGLTSSPSFTYATASNELTVGTFIFKDQGSFSEIISSGMMELRSSNIALIPDGLGINSNVTILPSGNIYLGNGSQGKVRIGDYNIIPTNALEVVGTVSISTMTGSNNRLVLSGTVSGALNSDQYLYFDDLAGISRLTIGYDSANKLGQIDLSPGSNTGVRLEGSTDFYLTTWDASGAQIFRPGGIERMRLDWTGLGIGKGASYSLDVVGTASFGSVIVSSLTGSTNRVVFSGTESGVLNSSQYVYYTDISKRLDIGSVYIQTYPYATIQAEIHKSDTNMTIQSAGLMYHEASNYWFVSNGAGGGNVRIGSYPTGASARLHISGVTAGAAAIRIDAGSVSSNPGDGDIYNNGSQIHIHSGLEINSLTGSTDRMVQADNTGVLSATSDIISAWVTDTSAISLITNTSNWNSIGQYIGGTISNTYQGQQYVDSNYYYIATMDDSFIRIGITSSLPIHVAPNQVAFGFSASGGLTSSSNFTYDGSVAIISGGYLDINQTGSSYAHLVLRPGTANGNISPTYSGQINYDDQENLYLYRGNNWKKLNDPMTTIGDIIYGGTGGTSERLPGNQTSTVKYLTSTGDGTTASPPTWSDINIVNNPNSYRILTANGTSSNTANAQSNLTFNPNTGVLSLTGSMIISGTPSGGTVFTINGSAGQLFSVNDSLIGSLFSVNDISGLPILEVFSDNTVIIGDYQVPSLYTTKKTTIGVGTSNIYLLATASYTGAYIDYTAVNGTNARAGSITAIWLGPNIQYTDNSTLDIGTTSGLTFSFVISGTYAVLQGQASSAGWEVKTIIRSI